MSPLQRAILAALADTSAHDQMSIPQLAERCRNHLQRGGAFTQITHAVEALTRCGHVHPQPHTPRHQPQALLHPDRDRPAGAHRAAAPDLGRRGTHPQPRLRQAPVLAGIHTSTAVTARRGGLGRGNVGRDFTHNPIRATDLVRKMTAACAATWAAGKTAIWSFKPHPADVASGAFRPHVQALAAHLRDNPDKPTIVVIWHEPENDIPQWFAAPEDFVRLFNTVHDWLKAVHPGLLTMHCALGYRYADRIDITDAVAPRWRTRADINAIDAYQGRTFPLGQILPEHTGYRRWRKYVAADGPLAVGERGFSAPPERYAERVATMARELIWLLDQDVAAYVIWDSEGNEQDPGLILDPSALAVGEATVSALLAAARPVTMTCPACAGTGTLRVK